MNDRSFLSDLLRHLLLGALVFGAALLLFGLAEAIVNTAVGLYQTPRVWVFLIAVYAAIGVFVGLGAGAVVTVWQRFGIGPRLLSIPLLVALFVAGYLFVFVGLPLNDHVLPGFFAPISLVSNAALFVACVAFGALVYRWLAPKGGLRLALAFVNLLFWYSICLSAGMYVDMYIAAAGAAAGGVVARYAAILVGCLLGGWLFAKALETPRGRPLAAAALVVAGGLVLLFGQRWIGPLTPTQAGREGKPNVLWIVMDTTRPDHLSVYGYERSTSPSLAKLVSDGVVFENAAAQAPWTMPSHFQMVTSRYDSGKETVLPEEYVTAAEILRDNGYDTGAVLGNFSLGRRSGFAQGFDDVMDGPVMVFFHKFIDKLPVVHWLIQSGLFPADVAVRWFHRHTFLEGVGARGSDLTNRALRWMTTRGDRPFFMFINYMDPHDAYDPPEPFRSRFADGIAPIKGFVRWDPDRNREIDSNTFVRDRLPKMQPKDWQQLVDLYDAEIAFLDAQLGRMFDELRARGLLDDTIVIVTADHGELFGEHQLAYHFKSLSEEETHVPLLMRYPKGLPAGERLKTPVEVNDVLPTVLALTGSSSEAQLNGKSLVELAKQGDSDGSIASAETFTYLLRKPDKRFAHTKPGDLFGRKTGTEKYVWSSGGQHEFYELAGDPKAHANRYGETPEVASAQSRLGEWRKKYGLEEVGEQKLDRLTRDRLKALGYID
jgi:arylsulfatase A-like enzyme